MSVGSAALGAVGAGLGLIALEAAVKGQGANELSGGFKIVDSGLKLLLDPSVPLIPDRRPKVSKTTTNNNPSPNPKKTPSNPPLGPPKKGSGIAPGATGGMPGTPRP